MSHQFSRKGNVTIRARDPKDGHIFHIAVKKGSKLHNIAESQKRRQQKQNQAAFRAFKAQMRQAKKAIPIEQRAKVNWSQVQNV
jgi:hypothetical protein